MASLERVRQWAFTLGYDIGERGRPPRPLVQRWNAENPDDPVYIPRAHNYGLSNRREMAVLAGQRGGLAAKRSRRLKVERGG